MSSETIVHVTDASFEDDVVKAKGPVLLDFWAEWCLLEIEDEAGMTVSD